MNGLHPSLHHPADKRMDGILKAMRLSPEYTARYDAAFRYSPAPPVFTDAENAAIALIAQASAQVALGVATMQRAIEALGDGNVDALDHMHGFMLDGEYLTSFYADTALAEIVTGKIK